MDELVRRRRRGTWELVILVLLVLAAIFLFMPYEHSTDLVPRFPQPAPYSKPQRDLQKRVDQARVVIAEVQAKRFLDAKGSGVVVEVRIESADKMPIIKNGGPYHGMRAAAHATKSWAGSCVIHLTPEVVEVSRVIAHEVCHCIQDYAVLSSTGFNDSVDAREALERDQLADICERDLIGD